MRALTFEEIECVAGSSKESYEAGHAVGQFIGKALVGSTVVIALCAAVVVATATA